HFRTRPRGRRRRAAARECSRRSELLDSCSSSPKRAGLRERNAIMSRRRRHHHRRYPRTLVSFTHLPGVNYGTAEVIANSRDELEPRVGVAFVRVARPAAEALAKALEHFLELQRQDVDDDEDDDVEEKSEVIDTVIVAHMRDHIVERGGEHHVPTPPPG